MQSHEAIQKAVNGKTGEIAKSLHLASVTIHKWQEASQDYTDSGILNPLDRLETIIQTALHLGTPSNSAHAPLHYLAERFGHVCFPLPKLTPSNELTSNLLQTIEEFSDLTHAASAALADNKVTKTEAKEIEREGMELVRQVMAFISKAKESVK